MTDVDTPKNLNNTFLSEMTEGFVIHEIIYKDDDTIDFKYVDMNNAFEKMIGKTNYELYHYTLRELFPNISQEFIAICKDIVENGNSTFFVEYFKDINKKFTIKAFKTGDNKFAFICTDISEEYINNGEYEYLIGHELNNFRIESILGSGAMGIVFKGFDIVLNRPVALKVLKKEFSNEENVVKRFKQEAEILAKLNNKNLVNIYTIETDLNTGLIFISMEYVEGEKLSYHIQKHFEWYWYLFVIYTCLLALKYAHNEGVIHRDLKPANILISKNTDVKIVDFGLSKYINKADSFLTKEDDILGTPLYIAPELWDSSKNTSPKCDIYSLGVVFYECIAKKHPFNGDTFIELYRNINTVQPRSLKEYDENIPDELNDVIINKMMHKDPEKRPNIDDIYNIFCSIIEKYSTEISYNGRDYKFIDNIYNDMKVNKIMNMDEAINNLSVAQSLKKEKSLVLSSYNKDMKYVMYIIIGFMSMLSFFLLYLIYTY